MTTTATARDALVQPIPMRMCDGARMLARLAQRIGGIALILSALGLWLLPGSNWQSDVALFKLLLSAAALIAGLSFLVGSVTPRRPQIEIDTARQELRIVRPAGTGPALLLERCRFADLGRVERDHNHLRFWDGAERLLAEVTLSDRQVLRSLLLGLRSAGKLV